MNVVDVWFEEAAPKPVRINAIQVLTKHGGVKLKEAKQRVEAGGLAVSGIGHDVAERVVAELAKHGVLARIEDQPDEVQSFVDAVQVGSDGYGRASWQRRSDKVKDKLADKIERALQRDLVSGEAVQLVVRASGMRPMIEVAVITTGRVLGYGNNNSGGLDLKTEIHLWHATNLELGQRMAQPIIVAKMADGTESKVPLRDNKDAPMVEEAISAVLVDLDVARGVQDAHASRQGAQAAHAAQVAQRTAEIQEARNAEAVERDAAWSSINVGYKVGGKGKQAILDHCGPGELPKFVIGGGIQAGALAAFEDRCMIVKTGGMTGLMAGSLFGGRITTFPYAQVTGIEYNSGLMNGVLEILTASYQGSANKDFWQGTMRGRNANSNDPFTLSNTLPLDKATYAKVRTHVEDMRRMIAEAHRPTVNVTVAEPAAPASPATSTNSGYLEELRELAKMRDEGILSDDEFAAQKARILADR